MSQALDEGHPARLVLADAENHLYVTAFPESSDVVAKAKK